MQAQVASNISLSRDFQSFFERWTASRPVRMLLIFAALWMTNVFDAGLTLMAHSQGVLHEMNPVGVWLLGYGPSAVIAYKVLMVTIATGLLWRMRHHPLAELAAWIELCAYILVCFRWQAYYEIYSSISDLALMADGGLNLL